MGKLKFPETPIFSISPPYRYDAIIKYIYDGDTFHVDIDLGLNVWIHDRSIRLYGINTPELRGPEREEGIKVRDAVRELIPVGSRVVLDTYKDKSGKYGRLLATVWTAHPSGEGWMNVNQWLLDNDMARRFLP